MRLRSDQIKGKVLDHLGIIAAVIEQLGLIEKIDHRIPISSSKGAKVSIGQRVAAMILNGLGFMDSRLYMFPEFLSNKPVERLLGAGLSADDFNDDILGRGLDKLFAYGTTKIFSELAFSIGLKMGLLGRSAHTDTSTLSVYGEYDKIDSDMTPTYGYSKDHRMDLKQVTIHLATTGASNFPIWMESHSGNASDKKVLREAAERMQKFCQQLKAAPSFLYVADSAMYESCLKAGVKLKWLSRVPGHIKAARSLLELDDRSFSWKAQGNGYRQCVIETRYRDIHQRWCMISSEQAYQRECKTLDRSVKKEQEIQGKALWHLSCQRYGCEADAQKAVAQFRKGLRYHDVDIQIVEIKKYTTKGRPKAGNQLSIVGYRIEGDLQRDENTIEKHRRRKGRFILSTNELDPDKLSNKDFLPVYKDQSKTESGFKFIKDNTFEIDSIFLKKPSRITALMMVMTLCLMVYSVAQYHLRTLLQSAKDSIPNQNGKPTQKPTMKRVLKLFHGIQVLTIKIEKTTQQLVINVNDVTEKVIRYFGLKAMRVYDLNT